MLNEKRIKSIIVITLLLLEAFVWTVNGPNVALSLGIIGGADGPTAIYIAKPEKEKDRKPEDAKSDNPNSNASTPPENNENRERSLEEVKEKGLLILVNKEHPIDKGYKPDDLKEIKNFVEDRSPASRYMRAEAADAFQQLVDKAAEENIELKMTTAYRSYDFQKLLYDSYVEKEGEDAASKFSAKPGRSEHQTGLAVDVSSPSVDYQLSDDYGATSEGKWLASHAHEFGFILRFPKGKEDITGYQYEPWHIRYVGLTAAEEIYKQKLTLEEYLQENNLQ